MAYFNNMIYFGDFSIVYDEITQEPIVQHSEGNIWMGQVYENETNVFVIEKKTSEGYSRLVSFPQ